MRAALLGALVVAAGSHVAITARFLAGKTVRVASGGDALWADVRGLEVDRMLREISAHVPAGASLAVVPEGVMLNYLARRPTSTRDISFMPVEMIMFGEDRMLAALAQHPPDFILLVARPLREYGFAGFGLDYAVPMAAWIGSHYHPLAGVPASPAMVLMRRNDGRRGRDRARGRRRAE